ncbi:MAG: TraB/GumN family protein [archaeon]
MKKKINKNITLVGVNHNSKKSYKEVKQVIRKEKPQVIGWELDRDRFNALINGSHSSINLPFSLVLFLFMSFLYNFNKRNIKKKRGVNIKFALKYAFKNDCNILLLDKICKDSIKDFKNKITVKEKLKIIFKILFFPLLKPLKNKINKQNLSVSKVIEDEKILEEYLNKVEKDFNTFYKTMVKKRNYFMSKMILYDYFKNEKNMIIIVGAAHFPGIYKQVKSEIQRFKSPLEIRMDIEEKFNCKILDNY